MHQLFKHGYFVLLLVSVLVIKTARADNSSAQLTIACSANFSATMEQLTALFIATYDQPIAIKVSTASSGTLATQIMHGAPFDLFFSADKAYPARLKKQGIGIELAQYAAGVLVLYANKQDVTLEQLTSRANNLTLAIANPKYAPYGKAAIQALEQLQFKPKRLIRGNSVLHAFQYVDSGHADLGFVAKSVLWPQQQAKAIEIPRSWYEPITQDVLLLSTSSHARAFFEFMQSKPAHTLIQKMGYKLP